MTKKRKTLRVGNVWDLGCGARVTLKAMNYRPRYGTVVGLVIADDHSLSNNETAVSIGHSALPKLRALLSDLSRLGKRKRGE